MQIAAKKYNLSLMIFRRDLRLYDNTALIAAARESKTIVPCFIFDPRQVEKENVYRSANAIQFLIESLQDLAKQLSEKKGRLFLFYGEAEKVVAKIIKDVPIEAIYFNKDYTPFSIKRDDAIEHLAHKAKIDAFSYHDTLIHEPDQIMTSSGVPYSVFTPFYKKSTTYEVPKPKAAPSFSCYQNKIAGMKNKEIYKTILKEKNPFIWVDGGRNEGKKILKGIGTFKNYNKIRDFPALATTNLSAYLKFGCLSIRETHKAIADKLGENHPLLRQLIWRDFWTYVAYHSPFVYGHAYQKKYDTLAWDYNKKHFELWCNGQTGFPIVDAGMRQLNKTGFMHNRVRMIVSSFLTKDLHISWLQGERYFAQQLVDYDPAVNNGNWQWAASTGCDAQPYFRIFNPWLQQKKFDPDCTYIKHWIPELKNITNKTIHNWFNPLMRNDFKGYPAPIVDHDREKKKAIARYKAC